MSVEYRLTQNIASSAWMSLLRLSAFQIYSDSKGQPQPCNVSTFLWEMPKYQLQNAPPDAVCLFFLSSVNAHIINAHALEPKRVLHPAMSVLSPLSTLTWSTHNQYEYIKTKTTLLPTAMPLLPQQVSNITTQREVEDRKSDLKTCMSFPSSRQRKCQILTSKCFWMD